MLAMRRDEWMNAPRGWRCAGAFVFLAVVFAGAQGTAQEEKPTFTLKAYESLMQVPALVLDSSMRPMRHPVDPARFEVSLDSGKKFSPTSVRVEGDDPLELAIVLDVSGEQKKLVESLPGAATEFVSALRPQDHLSIYALDCGDMFKSADRIGPDAKGVQQAMEDVLASPRVAKRLKEGPCPNRDLIWNAMLEVVKDLRASPARRSMLVVSDGVDRGSRITWSQLHNVAGVQGVALFGMNDRPQATTEDGVEVRDRFYALCTSTGGVVLHAPSSSSGGKTAARWVELLRGRYVIEFPRPQQMTAALHSIVVSIHGDSGVFVTVAGVPVTVPSATELADPERVHSDAGADIPMGTRRPLVDGR